MELIKKYIYLEIVISVFWYFMWVVEVDMLGGVGGLDGMKRLYRKIRLVVVYFG